MPIYEILKVRTRETLGRYLGNERGQDVLTWLIILAILWLLISAAKLTVQ